MTKNDPFATTETFVAEARRLRAFADESEQSFLNFLVEGEKHPELWQNAGIPVFTAFLKATNICEPSRYEKYKYVIESVGKGAVEGIGAHGVVAVAALKTSAAIKDTLARMSHFHETNGTTVSEQTAKEYVRETRTRDAASATKNKSYVSLSEECARLRARVAELESENSALRSELRQFKRVKKSTKSKNAA